MQKALEGDLIVIGTYDQFEYASLRVDTEARHAPRRGAFHKLIVPRHELLVVVRHPNLARRCTVAGRMMP